MTGWGYIWNVYSSLGSMHQEHAHVGNPAGWVRSILQRTAWVNHGGPQPKYEHEWVTRQSQHMQHYNARKSTKYRTKDVRHQFRTNVKPSCVKKRRHILSCNVWAGKVDMEYSFHANLRISPVNSLCLWRAAYQILQNAEQDSLGLWNRACQILEPVHHHRKILPLKFIFLLSSDAVCLGPLRHVVGPDFQSHLPFWGLCVCGQGCGCV